MADDVEETPEQVAGASDMPKAASWGWRPGLRLGGRAVALGVLPGMLLYLALFGLSVWLHRSVEYMGVEDEGLAARIMKVFKDEVTTQQLGLLAMYLMLGALVGLVAFVYLELALRLRRRPTRWWRHGLAAMALSLGIHSWYLIRSAHHYPQLYSTQTANSTYLDILFSLGVDGLEPWFVTLIAVLFWLSGAVLGLLLLLRWADETKLQLRWLVLGTGLFAGLVFGVLTASDDGPEIRRSAATATATGSSALAPAQRPPNVLLIAVDSLRGDVVGDGSITPHIDRFALRGTRFTHAFSVMPRTFPAWASILTGQFPHTHGIRHMFPNPATQDKIEGSMATVLGAQGYRTGLISDFAGDVFTRRDFGFDHLDAPEFTLRSNVRLGGLKLHVHLMPYLVDVFKGRESPELAANERLGDPGWLTDKALEWIGGPEVSDEDLEKPFFLTVFYSAGHFPFAAPAPFYSKFTDPEYRGRSRFHKEAYGKPLEGKARTAEETHLRHLFLGALAASDHAIGRLLARLETAGVLDNTIVVLTADHGENLYEHGLGVGHGDHLYGLAGVHVPLIFVLPSAKKKKGRRLVAHESVRLVDLAPTVLAELNVEPLVEPEGVDLRPYMWASDKPLPSLPGFAETGLWFYPPETKRLKGRMISFAAGFEAFTYTKGTWEIYLKPVYEETAIMAKHRMLLEGDRKLLYIPTRDGVLWELFDPYGDPGEVHNLVTREPKRFAAMKSKLFQWMLRDPQMVRVGDFVLPKGPLGPIGDAADPPEP